MQSLRSAGLTRIRSRTNGNGRNWATPPEVFEPLNREFRFTLDPCATPETAKCPLFYTEAEDGLSKDWTGHRVFMNPPYGKEIPPWTRKARDSGVLVVGLLPASTDRPWWHEDVIGHAKVRYIRGRVRFISDSLGHRCDPFAPSLFVIWGNA